MLLADKDETDDKRSREVRCLFFNRKSSDDRKCCQCCNFVDLIPLIFTWRKCSTLVWNVSDIAIKWATEKRVARHGDVGRRENVLPIISPNASFLSVKSRYRRQSMMASPKRVKLSLWGTTSRRRNTPFSPSYQGNLELPSLPRAGSWFFLDPKHFFYLHSRQSIISRPLLISFLSFGGLFFLISDLRRPLFRCRA